MISNSLADSAWQLDLIPSTCCMVLPMETDSTLPSCFLMLRFQTTAYAFFSTCRVYPDGKVEYLHPMDGVYPEKVNAGRTLVNCNMRRIGENVNPIKVGPETMQGNATIS